jgi:hypothetical protein
MLATVVAGGDLYLRTFVFWHLVEMRDDLLKAERAHANNSCSESVVLAIL